MKAAALQLTERYAVRAMIAKHLTGVSLKHPAMILKSELTPFTTSFVWMMRFHTRVQYSAALYKVQAFVLKM